MDIEPIARRVPPEFFYIRFGSFRLVAETGVQTDTGEMDELLALLPHADLHVLGYFVDPAHGPLRERLLRFREVAESVENDATQIPLGEARRGHAALDQMPVQHHFHVPGSLEFFEDDFVHARAGIDQRGGRACAPRDRREAIGECQGLAGRSERLLTADTTPAAPAITINGNCTISTAFQPKIQQSATVAITLNSNARFSRSAAGSAARPDHRFGRMAGRWLRRAS